MSDSCHSYNKSEFSLLKIHNEEHTVFFLILFSKTEGGTIIKVTGKYMLAQNKENLRSG